jgi:demethylmenaquinone methyltransferase/2-methoxy-6-polyprenyl-1,4-benzoquinol methylase
MDFPLKNYYKDIYRRYDLVNRIFTFGQDRIWRRKAVEVCLRGSPERILDICTGTGDLIIEIADAAKGARELIGYDFSPEMLKRAAEKADRSAGDIRFLEGDVSRMPFEKDYFDVAGITFGIRNLIFENTNAARHLSEINRVLTPGGRLVVLESSKPVNRVWRFINGIYLQFMLPYLGGILSGNLKAYRYLARSSRNYYTIPEMISILESNGFNVIEHKSLFLGSVMLLDAIKQK